MRSLALDLPGRHMTTSHLLSAVENNETVQSKEGLFLCLVVVAS